MKGTITILGSNFYHQIIKKYVTIFGVLFNAINITRTNDDDEIVSTEKVPLTYSPKDKMLARLIQDPNIDRPLALKLPHMAFQCTNIIYDPARRLSKTGAVVVAGDDPNHMKRQYNPVPYNFNFELYVITKAQEDMTKIVEQILPFFGPDYTVTAHLIPEMGITRDIPIILNQVSPADYYEGDVKADRKLLWTLSFTLKGYLYGPVYNKPIIKFVNSNTYVTANTSSTDDPVLNLRVYPGLDANGEATSNSSLSIDTNLINFDDDYGYIIVANTGPFGN